MFLVRTEITVDKIKPVRHTFNQMSIIQKSFVSQSLTVKNNSRVKNLLKRKAT